MAKPQVINESLLFRIYTFCIDFLGVANRENEQAMFFLISLNLKNLFPLLLQWQRSNFTIYHHAPQTKHGFKSTISFFRGTSGMLLTL